MPPWPWAKRHSQQQQQQPLPLPEASTSLTFTCRSWVVPGSHRIRWLCLCTPQHTFCPQGCLLAMRLDPVRVICQGLFIQNVCLWVRMGNVHQIKSHGIVFISLWDFIFMKTLVCFFFFFLQPQGQHGHKGIWYLNSWTRNIKAKIKAGHKELFLLKECCSGWLKINCWVRLICVFFTFLHISVDFAPMSGSILALGILFFYYSYIIYWGGIHMPRYTCGG